MFRHMNRRICPVALEMDGERALPHVRNCPLVDTAVELDIAPIALRRQRSADRERRHELAQGIQGTPRARCRGARNPRCRVARNPRNTTVLPRRKQSRGHTTDHKVCRRRHRAPGTRPAAAAGPPKSREPLEPRSTSRPHGAQSTQQWRTVGPFDATLCNLSESRVRGMDQ